MGGVRTVLYLARERVRDAPLRANAALFKQKRYLVDCAEYADVRETASIAARSSSGCDGRFDTWLS